MSQVSKTDEEEGENARKPKNGNMIASYQQIGDLANSLWINRREK